MFISAHNETSGTEYQREERIRVRQHEPGVGALDARGLVALG